jgi:hypothetical protein
MRFELRLESEVREDEFRLFCSEGLMVSCSTRPQLFSLTCNDDIMQGPIACECQGLASASHF